MEWSYIWLPKSIDAPPGLLYADAPDEWKRYRYKLAERMIVMQPQNSGSHAIPSGDNKALCMTGPWTNAESLTEGTPEEVAPRVTCKFCQARLVHAGVMDPNAAQAYARCYGTNAGGDSKA